MGMVHAEQSSFQHFLQSKTQLFANISLILCVSVTFAHATTSGQDLIVMKEHAPMGWVG